MKAKSFTREGIIEALEEGSFYASTGPEIYDFYVENGVAAVLACIEPVMATVFGIFFFSELPSLAGWTGILLVLTALTILNLQPKKHNDIE